MVTLNRMEAGSTVTATSDAVTLSSVASEAPKAVVSKDSTVPEATKEVMSMRPCQGVAKAVDPCAYWLT